MLQLSPKKQYLIVSSSAWPNSNYQIQSKRPRCQSSTMFINPLETRKIIEISPSYSSKCSLRDLHCLEGIALFTPNLLTLGRESGEPLKGYLWRIFSLQMRAANSMAYTAYWGRLCYRILHSKMHFCRLISAGSNVPLVLHV